MGLAAPATRAQVDPQAAGFCATVLEIAEQASRASSREHAFRLCGGLVTLRAVGSGFEGHLTRALRHARVDSGAVAGAGAPGLRGGCPGRGGPASAGLAPPLR